MERNRPGHGMIAINYIHRSFEVKMEPGDPPIIITHIEVSLGETKLGETIHTMS